MCGTIYTSRCCGSCLHMDDDTPSLRCEKGGNLIVDAFFVCPLWEKRMWEEYDG